MSEAKVWTPEERKAATIKIKTRYGHDYPYKAEVDLQCELNEARELLTPAMSGMYSSPSEREDWIHRRQEWLKRNTEVK